MAAIPRTRRNKSKYVAFLSSNKVNHKKEKHFISLWERFIFRREKPSIALSILNLQLINDFKYCRDFGHYLTVFRCITCSLCMFYHVIYV